MAHPAPRNLGAQATTSTGAATGPVAALFQSKDQVGVWILVAGYCYVTSQATIDCKRGGDL